jgi:hypothetical protein
MITKSEENYIKSIFMLSHKLNIEVTTSSLANHLYKKASFKN